MADKFIINQDFNKFESVFLSENAKLNLISKKDEEFLFEKHIYDSLAIKLTGLLKDGQTLLDIGCGGGFPSVPIAIEYPKVNVIGIDSIRKKINAVNNIKNALGIDNLTTVCDRVENLEGKKFDIITSRAVADLGKISAYALPLLKKDGYFIAYKSKKAYEEIKNAQQTLAKYKAKVIKTIEYTLPLPEVYNRILVIISF